MRTLAIFCLTSSIFFNTTSTFAHSHKAHVHGVAKLDIVIEGSRLSLHLDTPLMNLLGFEHTPSNNKERQAVQHMVRFLRDNSTSFIPTAAAQCHSVSIKLTSSLLDPILLGENEMAAITTYSDSDGHSDLNGDFVFQCNQPIQLRDIEANLFHAFPNLQRIDVRMSTVQRQSAIRITPTASKITW